LSGSGIEIVEQAAGEIRNAPIELNSRSILDPSQVKQMIPAVLHRNVSFLNNRILPAQLLVCPTANMVSLEEVRHSNASLAARPKATGLVAVFVGASSGIGQSALEHFAKGTISPKIYSTARGKSAASHKKFLDELKQANPTLSYTLLHADASLVSDIDNAMDTVLEIESKVDLLLMSAGFFAFEGRVDTREGLDPSMSTRYYCRQRAAERLIPLLKAAPSPRIVSILAAGEEAPLAEDDLDLRDPQNWTMWNASRHAATMSTLSLERLAQQHSELSITHCHPGAVSTPGLARSNANGLNPANPRTQSEAGERALFIATSDKYAIKAGLAPLAENSSRVPRSGGGIFMVGSQGEEKNNEIVLRDMRERQVDQKVWDFTQEVFARIAQDAKQS
jgi:NAD(P)-dependent dehydrogenase (short-subunit alcohol dehydrogenase family)